MSCLDATFTLTPQSPNYLDDYKNTINYATLYCYGADFWASSPYDLLSDYASNRFFFDSSFAAGPNLDYAQWANRRKTRFLQSYINLPNYAAAQKQLALIFGFDVPYSSTPEPGRVLVYSDAGLLKDQQLVFGDNQFLLEIESLDQAFYLYFIHAGGHWFFRGLSGYVA
jgi:hypothetical protein